MILHLSIPSIPPSFIYPPSVSHHHSSLSIPPSFIYPPSVSHHPSSIHPQYPTTLHLSTLSIPPSFITPPSVSHQPSFIHPQCPSILDQSPLHPSLVYSQYPQFSSGFLHPSSVSPIIHHSTISIPHPSLIHPPFILGPSSRSLGFHPHSTAYTVGEHLVLLLSGRLTYENFGIIPSMAFISTPPTNCTTWTMPSMCPV